MRFVERQYYVYVLTNRSQTLYGGVTNDLGRRVYEYRQKLVPGFTAKYNVTRLVYYEVTPDVRAAISREKQIKGWTRARKLQLVTEFNPAWRDLSSELFGAEVIADDGDSSLRSE